LRISTLAIGASLRVSDSLQEGASHFSAEISRIRQIVEIAREGPALFLIDEIMQGTNSHDRLIGADAVIRKLLASGAIGLVTTHDLALTGIASDTTHPAVNVHFQDHIQNGKMAFDYKLKQGVVQGSNALELMRLYDLI
jgi:DNA mismatch repair ATPase MutS